MQIESVILVCLACLIIGLGIGFHIGTDKALTKDDLVPLQKELQEAQERLRRWQ